jgi:hypothetical protein
MRNFSLVVLFVLTTYCFLTAQPLQTENLILITLDGFRWQELFNGADSTLLMNSRYVKDENMVTGLWNSDVERRREKLLPFFWNVIGRQGQLYGNRGYNNNVNCKNPFWFSYPGYSEMLVGFVDRRANSNRKVVNHNSTVLEHINGQPGFEGKVAAYSTWDVVPFIIRETVSGIPVNKNKVGFMTEEMREQSSTFIDSSYHEHRDVLTFHAAFNYLKQCSPRVMYISFDETDSFAHKGRYDKYLNAAQRTDRMISELWNWLQSQPQYKDKTTLLITTDHGRGKRGKGWTNHGRIFAGSSQIWFGVLGPDTPPIGEVKFKKQFYQKQIAKTAAAFLGLDYTNVATVGEIIQPMFPQRIMLVNDIVLGR